MTRRLDWARDSAGWPHREASRFVAAGGFDWHVQILGQGPVLLLVHGTGASTHSFRDLATRLASDYTIVMADLPSHGFTDRPPWQRPSLPGWAAMLGSLLDRLEVRPTYAAGHSAGAAILARMALDGLFAPERIVSLNGALLPFPGVAAHLFPQLAKLLFLNPVAPRFFSWRARNGGAVARLMASTGSRLTPEGIAYYERLLASPRHVEGALTMMANWDLESLARDLPRLETPLTLVVGTADRAIPSEVSHKVARIVGRGEVVPLTGLGHLSHEEAPDRVAAAMQSAFARQSEAVPANA